MSFSRRNFLRTALNALALPCAAAAFASERRREPFPALKSDVEAVPYRYRKRVVNFKTAEKAGTIIIDTPNRYLYFILGDGKAMRYGVGVGKEGFQWSGEAVVGRKAKWPRWTPTPEQLARIKSYAQYAKGMPPGHQRNPMGARGIYLYQNGKDTLYRIHGTSEPSTIGSKVSSGCLRMINVEVIDLFDRVEVGTRVIVLDRPAI
jgi:lipoprotein-anchoring transpeptidase ErfK/SrfK